MSLVVKRSYWPFRVQPGMIKDCWYYTGQSARHWHYACRICTIIQVNNNISYTMKGGRIWHTVACQNRCSKTQASHSLFFPLIPQWFTHWLKLWVVVALCGVGLLELANLLHLCATWLACEKINQNTCIIPSILVGGGYFDLFNTGFCKTKLLLCSFIHFQTKGS